MKSLASICVGVSLIVCSVGHAADIFVNSTDSTITPPPGQTNLWLAISLLQNGDTIRFNISGSGPHYLQTPAGGYPLITKHNVTIDGYSQPGAVVNTNPILAANNAQIRIVLASTNGNYTSMDYNSGTNGAAGFDASEMAVLGIYGATNVQIRGLSLLGTGSGYGIAIARGTAYPANGAHINGCWIGVAPDATTVRDFDDAIAAFSHRYEASYRFRGTNGVDCGYDVTLTNRNPGLWESDRELVNIFTATNTCAATNHTLTVNLSGRYVHFNHLIGVKPGSLSPRSEFNVIVGATIPIIMEGYAFRISGNFLGVLPDGVTQYLLPVAQPGQFAESFIEIGRGVSDVVIGTDGDGVNDAEERNVLGGVVTDGGGSSGSINRFGYRHNIEFYSASGALNANGTPGDDRQRVRVAGNYVGIGVDGVTRFTNGVPILNGSSSGGTHYWVGSDFDGVSDDIEANVFYGNYPGTPGYFYATGYTNSTRSGSGSHGFFDEPDPNAGGFSTRGNKIVNCYPYPFNPQRNNSFANITTYVNKALAVAQPATAAGFEALKPVISPSSSTAWLVGTAPANNATYPYLIIDVYLPDQEGLTNGLVVPDPYLTNGWIHGETYLGSFLDNGPFDVNPAAGQFDFDLFALSLAAETQITVSANYSKDAPGTHNARVLTSLFANPVTLPLFIPGGVASVGLTHIVPDVPVWYSTSGNRVTNGPINNPADQTPTLANWEPYIDVLGDSTFLVGFNTYADDQTPPAGATIDAGAPFQRFAVALQPAAGGAAKIGEHFYTDAGAPYRGVVNYRRQNGNPQRVAGDTRYGAANFITAAETSLGQNNPAFQSDTRWTSNASYLGANAYVTVQTFSLNPATLSQTPLAKAFDPIYGNFVTATAPATQTQVSRTGGRPIGLDNGNFVVVSDDRTGYLDPDTEVSTFSIITPSGAVVKSATLVSLGDQWDNVAAFKGGFAVRPAGGLLYFYDNAGNLQGSVDHNASSGLSFNTGRGDGLRTASDIRSHYVYMAARSPDSATGPIWLAVWDATTRAFVAKVKVNEQNDGFANDRTGLAVDALDRVCVAYVHRPTADFPNNQVAARVLRFDGANFSPLTHSFFPFVNYDPDGALGPNGDLIQTLQPSVAMTTRQICIAAKGTINSTNNAVSGGDTFPETTVYTVISHPAPVAAPRPVLTITRSGGNDILSWNADDGLFTLHKSTTIPGGFAPVVPQPPIIKSGNSYTMTVASSPGSVFYRLSR